jgi:hypothetical protein
MLFIFLVFCVVVVLFVFVLCLVPNLVGVIGNLNDFFCLTEKMVIDIVPWSVLSTDRPETYRSQAVPVYLRGKN